MECVAWLKFTAFVMRWRWFVWPWMSLLWHSEFQQIWVGLSNMKIIIPELVQVHCPFL